MRPCWASRTMLKITKSKLNIKDSRFNITGRKLNTFSCFQSVYAKSEVDFWRMKNDEMKIRPRPISTLLRTAMRSYMNRKVCSTLIYTLTEKEPTHTHTYAFMGYTLKGSLLHVILSPTGEYLGSMLIRTDESRCWQHLKIINQYACIMRWMNMMMTMRSEDGILVGKNTAISGSVSGFLSRG